MNYSRKRAAEIDQEILEKGSPARVDGFDEMILPLIEDMTGQMKAIADRKQISLGTNFPDEAEAREKASEHKALPLERKKKEKPKALSFSEAKKKLLEKVGESSYLDLISRMPESAPEESEAVEPESSEEDVKKTEESTSEAPKETHDQEMDFSAVEDLPEEDIDLQEAAKEALSETSEMPDEEMDFPDESEADDYSDLPEDAEPELSEGDEDLDTDDESLDDEFVDEELLRLLEEEDKEDGT